MEGVRPVLMGISQVVKDDMWMVEGPFGENVVNEIHVKKVDMVMITTSGYRVVFDDEA